MAPSRVPARLHVILARNAPIAVILRRGPSKYVQVSLWRTDTDNIEHGQWLKGHIYSRRCDLSPDGSLFLYFARKKTYTWTAISKPPFLTDLALWPKDDSWNGGGLFLDNNSVWINHPEEDKAPDSKHVPPETFLVDVHVNYRGEDETVEAIKRERDGWTLFQKGKWKSLREIQWPYKYRAEAPTVYEKANPHNGASLFLKLVGLESRAIRASVEEYYVRSSPGSAEHPIKDASWADWDQQNRVVFARDGKLFSGKLQNDELIEEELADLDDQHFEEVVAPEWAQRW